MTTYTSHGTYCNECNRLARVTEAKAAETGEPQSQSSHAWTRLHFFHFAVSRDNGNNKRITGDEDYDKEETS